MPITRDFSPVSRAVSILRRFASARAGVAAMEFALIAPLLLTLYFVTMEVSQAIETNKKVGRTASMVGDLVTQQQEITPDEIQGIMRIGESILQPYNRTKPTITVTQIFVNNDATPRATVSWSRRLKDGSFTTGEPKNSMATIPESMLVPNTFLVRVRTELDYKPVITWTAEQKVTAGLFAAFDNIDMAETNYLRPRMSAQVDCKTC